jgi:hypothetical protein
VQLRLTKPCTAQHLLVVDSRVDPPGRRSNQHDDGKEGGGGFLSVARCHDEVMDCDAPNRALDTPQAGEQLDTSFRAEMM